ncbi:MAG: hypothetical protein ABIS14_01510 [Sphingomonas sp.]
MIRLATLALVFALPLAACGSGKDGTSIAFNANGSGGNVLGGVDAKSGEMSINAPGFSGKINLPKIRLDADNVDLNGVHLYPGSKVAAMKIDAHDDGKLGKDDGGTVKISFESPAGPDTVRAWFENKLSHAGFTVHDDGTGLSGTTDEHKPFTLDLSPDGADHAKGTMTIG